MIRKTIIWSFVSILVILILLIVVYFWEPWLLRDFSEAENAELVFGIDIDGKAEFEKIVILTDAERNELISYLDADAVFGWALCTPEQISIRLSKGNKKVMLFPACDGCNGLGFKTNIESKTVSISKENMNGIITIIQDHMPSQEEMPLLKNYEYYKHEWHSW